MLYVAGIWEKRGRPTGHSAMYIGGAAAGSDADAMVRHARLCLVVDIARGYNERVT